MKFAKWVFRIAGIWGIVVLTPLYFNETNTRVVPLPLMNHPEYFYGFIGIALAWQVAFLLIATDPLKYRLLMVPSMLEKFSFAATLLVLLLTQRVGSQVVLSMVTDTILGVFFVASYFLTRNKE